MRDIITKLEELNVEKEQLNEGHMGDEAHKMELDHEVQMARSDLYKAAKYAVSIHKMMKDISEMEGIDGWVASKITKASDYLGSVKHYLEGMKFQDVELAVVPVAGDMTDAMTMPEESVEVAEAVEEVTEDVERIIKVSNIDYAGPALDKLPTETTLKLDIPSAADEDQIYDMVADELEDRHGVKVDGFDMNFAESVEDMSDQAILDEKDEDVIGDIIASLGKMKTPGVMPKPKPKMSTNMKTGATRGAGDDADYMKAAAMANMPDQAKQKMMNKMMVKDSKFSEWGKK